MIQFRRLSVLITIGLAGCLPAPGSDLAWLEKAGSHDAEPAACYETDSLPAIIETVTEQELVTPEKLAADGSVETAAVYRSRSAQKIVRERREMRIETPCPALMTPDFIATLQRALAARGLYRGSVTGTMDPATRAAVEAYQTDRGLPSAILSTTTARQLGLITAPRDALASG